MFAPGRNIRHARSWVEQSFEVNFALAGVSMHAEASKAPGFKKGSRVAEALRALSRTVARATTVYRGTQFASPVMIARPDSGHHIELIDRGVPYYVVHPLSCSSKRSVARDFAGSKRKPGFVHIIRLRQGTRVVENLAEVVGDGMRAGFDRAVAREREIIIAHDQWLIPMERKGRVITWEARPTLIS